MGRIVGTLDRYKILKSGDGFVVINAAGSRENHGHFKSAAACYHIVRMVKKRVIPKSPYMIEAAWRLTSDKDYKDRLKTAQERLYAHREQLKERAKV